MGLAVPGRTGGLACGHPPAHGAPVAGEGHGPPAGRRRVSADLGVGCVHALLDLLGMLVNEAGPPRLDRRIISSVAPGNVVGDGLGVAAWQLGC